ncbi:MAG: hypothetical protein ACETVZ_02845 [Phycisphaerae bacterium]
MKQKVFYKMAGFVALTALVTLWAPATAKQAKKGIIGDWLLTSQFDDRQMTSILSLSTDKQGQLSGQWISFWGLSELSDIKYEENKLSFVQTGRYRDREYRSEFTGAIKRGKLSGSLSSERGESKVEGERIRPIPSAVGTWEMKIKVGEREYSGTLVVKADKERKLTADWQSEMGEHEITDVKLEKNKLTFNRKSKIQDRQWESTFEGTVKGHTLSGTFKSERGETAAEGKRIGAALIGKWDLEMTSEEGSRRQILRINPDLSGMYGPMTIEKVNLEDDQATFKIVQQFGDRKFELSFAGKLDGRKLTGEITSSRGTRKVTGKKVVPAAKK